MLFIPGTKTTGDGETQLANLTRSLARANGERQNMPYGESATGSDLSLARRGRGEIHVTGLESRDRQEFTTASSGVISLCLQLLSCKIQHFRTLALNCRVLFLHSSLLSLGISIAGQRIT